MNGAELLSRTLSLSWSAAEKDHKHNEAVWKGERWLKEHGGGGGEGEAGDLKDAKPIE
jgi:hypothetical protein